MLPIEKEYPAAYGPFLQVIKPDTTTGGNATGGDNVVLDYQEGWSPSEISTFVMKTCFESCDESCDKILESAIALDEKFAKAKEDIVYRHFVQ